MSLLTGKPRRDPICYFHTFAMHVGQIDTSEHVILILVGFAVLSKILSYYTPLRIVQQPDRLVSPKELGTHLAKPT